MKLLRIQLLAIAGIAFILAMLSPAAHTAQSEQSSRILNDYRAGSIKHRNASLAITPDVVRYKLKQKQKIILVDVRNRKDFERSHIPGSINLPLFALKIKFFLRSSPIVLINDGFQYRLLENECRQLKGLGINAQILDGGLTAWKRAGGPLAGDLADFDAIRTVAPQVLFREKDYPNILMIDISPGQSATARELLPDSIQLPIRVNSRQWAKELEQIMKSRHTENFSLILIFNETGEKYESINKVLALRGLYAFFLRGGLAGYKRYLEDLTVSWLPQDSRIKTSRPCKTCSQEIQDNPITKIRN